jgi:hypothetical protein
LGGCKESVHTRCSKVGRLSQPSLSLGFWHAATYHTGLAGVFASSSSPAIKDQRYVQCT